VIAAARSRRAQVAALALLAALAMALAWSRAWVCDDAFISFRYAQNLAEGHGLVFNQGERVEGYSNFAWTLLCALAIRLGADPVAFAQALGVLCLGATVLATAWAGRRLLPGETSFLPLAAVGTALHHHLGDFATCGLETLAFVLLVVAVTGVLARAESPRAFAAAAVLAVLAALVRPDGALLGAVAAICASAAAVRQRRWAPVLACAVPGIVLFAPFLCWRLAYYGDLLPNTFYAKSAHDPYAGQGWFYVRLFLDGYWVLWPAAAALPALLLLRRRGGAIPLLAGVTSLYLAFVVWVGGDFMFARFCLPVTPLLYLVLEALTRRYVPGAARLGVLAAVAAGTLVFHERADLLVLGGNVRGVADERAQYPAERAAAIRDVGRRLGEATRGAELRVAFSGTQAMLVYEARVHYALEAVTGLTDRWLARRELAERGIVGHEKGIFASPEALLYALETQRVHFLLFDHPPVTQAQPWRRIALFGMPATIARWDRAVMARLLGRSDVVATDFQRFLDDYLAGIEARPVEQVRADFGAFEQFYFRGNDDPVRRARFLERLGRG
jgi:hypothetical protein